MITRKSKYWSKKRVRQMIEEIQAYIRHRAKPESGGHSINIYDPHKAGCGICAALKDAQRFIRILGQDGDEGE